MSRYEIVTIYWGEQVTGKEAGELSAWVIERYPDKEAELVEGRQPHYQYVISAE